MKRTVPVAKEADELVPRPDLGELPWNVWDWPMAEALELANIMGTSPLPFELGLEMGNLAWP